jgi:hypothetical protein
MIELSRDSEGHYRTPTQVYDACLRRHSGENRYVARACIEAMRQACLIGDAPLITAFALASLAEESFAGDLFPGRL